MTHSHALSRLYYSPALSQGIIQCNTQKWCKSLRNARVFSIFGPFLPFRSHLTSPHLNCTQVGPYLTSPALQVGSYLTSPALQVGAIWSLPHLTCRIILALLPAPQIPGLPLPIPGGTCTNCDKGEYSVMASSSCSICRAGKYSPNVGASVCLECQEGKHLEDDGNDVTKHTSNLDCSLCGAGSYSNVTGERRKIKNPIIPNAINNTNHNPWDCAWAFALSYRVMIKFSTPGTEKWRNI